MAVKHMSLAFVVVVFASYIETAPVLSKEKPADADAKTAFAKAFANDPDMKDWMGSALSSAKQTPVKYATTVALDGRRLYFIKVKLELAGSQPVYSHYEISKDGFSGTYKGEQMSDTQGDGTPHTATDPITYFGDLAGEMATKADVPVPGPTLSKEKPADSEVKNALDQAFKNDPRMEGWISRMLNFAKRTPLKYATATSPDGKKLYFIKTKVEPTPAKNPDYIRTSGSEPMYVVYEVSKDSKGIYKGEGVHQEREITATSPIVSF